MAAINSIEENTMKRTTILFAAFIAVQAVLLVAQTVDFDGQSKVKKTIAGYINDVGDASVSAVAAQTPKAGSGAGPAGAGDWNSLQPIRVEVYQDTCQSENTKDDGLLVRREVLAENGEWVEINPVLNKLSVDCVKAVYSIKPGYMTRWSLRCAKGKWSAKTTYSMNSVNAGHSHSDVPFPPLSISSISVLSSTAAMHEAPSPIIFTDMKANTTYYYWEQMPIFATSIMQRFEASGACTATQTDTTNVEYPGLIELPASDNYFGGHNPPQSTAHTSNNFGTQKLISAIQTIANEYHAAFPNADVLYVYDMSLPYGGIIDVNRNWKRPFFGHEYGIDADISKMEVPQENRAKLLEIMCKNADTYTEQDVPGEAPYFHIRVYTPAGVFGDDLEKNSKTTVRCCKGTAINPDVIDVCLSTQGKKLR